MRSRRAARASRHEPAGLRAAVVPSHPPTIDVTGTFKQKKIDLVREGFNPAATTDPIYFNDPQSATPSCRSTPALYRRIESGEIRL